MPRNRTPQEVDDALDAIRSAVSQIYEINKASGGTGSTEERVTILEAQMGVIANLLVRL
jgi:hypothetical protein